MAVEYVTNPSVDSLCSDTNLVIFGYQHASGIELEYRYGKIDTVNEYCLQRIMDTTKVPVCSIGKVLLENRTMRHTGPAIDKNGQVFWCF